MSFLSDLKKVVDNSNKPTDDDAFDTVEARYFERFKVADYNTIPGIDLAVMAKKLEYCLDVGKPYKDVYGSYNSDALY